MKKNKKCKNTWEKKWQMKYSHALEKSQRSRREHDVQLCQQNYPNILAWNISNIGKEFLDVTMNTWSMKVEIN